MALNQGAWQGFYAVVPVPDDNEPEVEELVKKEDDVVAQSKISISIGIGIGLGTVPVTQ